MSDHPPGPLIDKNYSKRDNNLATLGSDLDKRDVLHSWKEISVYLDRDVRTCHRWEDELGLPIHRIDENSSRSKVFAYKEDIDEWLKIKAENHKHKKITSIWTNKRVIAGLAGVFLLLSVIFAWLYFFQSPALPSFSGPTLTVLPLKNLNSSEYEEYFSEGIMNEIERSRIRLNKIRVIPGSTDDPSQHSTLNMEILGQKLKPDYLVMGEIRQEKDKILLSISLIRTEDNKNLWNGSYESDQEDILNVSRSISHKIHEQLDVKVDEVLFDRSKRGSTGDFSAYDTFLKGNFILSRIAEQDDDPWKLYHQGKYLVGRWTPESNELAISFFSQAIAIDSNYALAYIGLAMCYANYVNLGWDSNIEWLDTAEDLLEKAQEISPDMPEYYGALIKIYVLREDFLNESTGHDILSLAKEAIAKYPNHPQLNAQTGYCYLRKFGESGDEKDFEKAFEYNERSYILNRSSLNNIKFAELLMLKKEFYRAIDVCHLIEMSDPSLYSQFTLGEIYYYLGDLDKSKEIFLKFDKPMNFNIHSLYYLAMIEAQKGMVEEAKRIVREVEFIKPEEYMDLQFHFEMASIFFGIGDEDSGYRYLESLFNDEQNQRDKFLYSKYTKIDRNFDNYRNKARFQNLIRGDH
jgi:TolB-like protein/TPR repeat protein